MDVAPGAAAANRARLRSRAGRSDAATALIPFGLAALSGAMFATAFPPLSWHGTAWIALAPFFAACARLSPRRAAAAGMCWTAAASVGVASFVPPMLSSYFGLAGLTSWLAALLIVAALHGSFVSAFAAWVAWLVERRAANPVLLAGGWMLCEFARAHGPLGSPWALAATSQLSWTAVIQIADLAGAYGIGVLIAAVNACVAACVVPALRGRQPRIAYAMCLTSFAGALAYGEFRLTHPFSTGAPVAVAVVQGGAPPLLRSQRPARLARYVELTSNGVAPHSQIIVWPEHATEAYLQEGSPTRASILGVSAQSGADLILGGPHYERSATGTRYHNSAYLVRDGAVAARYDKHRLVPFAEDEPLAWLLGHTPGTYSAGRGSFVLTATSLRVGVALCVEAMFPALVSRAVEEGAELLVVLSNDDWFGEAAAARQQLDIAALRAVENRRYLLRAASTGISAVVDPYGRRLAESEFDTVEVLNASVRALQVRTPYQRCGDAFAWLVISAVLATTLRLRLTRNVAPQPRRFS